MKKLEDFKRYIELHRQRVVNLGMALARSQFPHLENVNLEFFLRLHDRSKTMSAPVTLKSYGYNNPLPPLERLFHFYGKSLKTETQNHDLKTLISDINSIDEKIALRFFENQKIFDPKMRESFFIIEKVADLVDRSLDPQASEEFGHHMILASEYVRDPYMANLSVWLEQNYLQLTENLSFSTYKKAE